MYKFFVTQDQVNQEYVSIQEEDFNHIKNVLRLTVKEQIEVTNITIGITYVCELEQIQEKSIMCKIIEQKEASRESKITLTIFQGLPKAEKLETIIQKTTELGVSQIIPVEMKRCIVKLEEKAKQKKVERWNKIAEVAAKQSKRERIPKINTPIPFSKVYEKIPEYDIVLIAYEEEKENSIKQILQQVKQNQCPSIAVIVGPEGGLEQTEVQQAIEHGAKAVTLGKRILRTETAPIALSSIIMYEFDEMK